MAEPSSIESFVGIYDGVLLVLGLTCLGIVLWRLPRWRAMHRRPGPWHLATLDFSLFAVLATIVWFVSSGFGGDIARLFLEPDFDDPTFLGLVGAVSGIFMQAGFIALYKVWRDFHRNEHEGPLNTRNLGPGKLAGTAVLFLLAAFPIVGASSFATHWGLQALQDAGVPIELEEQLAVGLFRQIENPWILGLLAFTAIVMAPIGEELVFRAGVYRFFLGRLGKPSAMIATGLLFGFIHFNAVGFAPLAVFGGLLCLAYDLSGNIRVPILMHMLFNAHTVLFLIFFPDTLPTV